MHQTITKWKEEKRAEWILEAESYDMDEQSQINVRKYDIADWWLSHLEIERTALIEEMRSKFIGEYDIADDNINMPYITGVLDKEMYSVDGLIDKILSHLESNNPHTR